MKRLLAVSTLFYCLGIILLSLTRVSFWLILVLGVAALAAACLNFRNNRIFTFLVFFFALILGALNLKNSYMRHKCHLSNFVPYNDGTVYSLSGFVDSQPVIEGKSTAFVFRAQEVRSGNWRWPCCGKVLVKADFPQDLDYAEPLVLKGALHRPFRSSSAGCSYRDFLSNQGIYLLMRIKNSLQIIPYSKSGSGALPPGCQIQPTGIKRLIVFSLWLRDEIERVIRRYLPDLPAGILSAMVLGQRRSIPRLVNNNMVKAGTVHILVVSGFNVGIVAFIVNLLLKIMRIRRKARIFLTIICLLIYCLTTGASNPVIRATVMGIVFLSAHIFKREADIYNCLASAAIFILGLNPRQLFDVGFQLSFASVLAIVCLYPKAKTFLRLDNCKSRPLRYIYEGCLVSFCAWIGTAGIVAYNFRIIAPITVLANILVVPLATLITLCGFSLVLCGPFCTLLGKAIGTTSAMLITLLLNVNAAVIKIPGAYFYF
ncbi:MAG: ComEC/Rec2 family competence protein [Candidatus Omnitrophica bacterium]|nr:ComEC/Rec2 family competence protein [Candidatus Omnitrophota bacterium]